MKTGLLSLFAGTALVAAVAAQAGEPITLDSSQMDNVSAGAALTVDLSVPNQVGLTGSTTLTTVAPFAVQGLGVNSVGLTTGVLTNNGAVNATPTGASNFSFP